MKNWIPSTESTPFNTGTPPGPLWGFLDQCSVCDLERMEREEMIYRVSFFYDKDHKTIVTMTEQEVKALGEALGNNAPLFTVEDFGRDGNTLFINLKSVRFTVVQESEGPEGALPQLSRVPELSND